MNTPEQSGHEDAPEDFTLTSAPLETVRPARSPQRIVRRKAILTDTDEVPAQSDPGHASAARSSVTYTTSTNLQQAGPGANARRRQNTLKLIAVVVLANNFLIAAAVVWFVSYTMGDIQSRLQGPFPAHMTAAPTATTSSGSPGASASAAELDKHTAVESSLKERIGELERQLDSTRQDNAANDKLNEQNAKKLDEMTRRIMAMASIIEDRSISHSAASVAPAATPEGTLELPPTQAEMVQLKERNRLTAFADEAISTGSRDAYEQLWKALTDPRLATLVHGARAEILRVQECYLSGQRVKYYGLKNYQMPIAELFPDTPTLTPAQLSDDQLIHILQDHQKAPWQAREKAAWYLGSRRTKKVGDALVKAVKEDPMLDVAAEATFSFEQVTNYHAKLFEPEAMEAWWKTYNSVPPDNRGPAAKKEAQVQLPEAGLAKTPATDATPPKNAEPKTESKEPDNSKAEGADSKSKKKTDDTKSDNKSETKKPEAKDKKATDKDKKEKSPAIKLREPDDKP